MLVNLFALVILQCLAFYLSPFPLKHLDLQLQDPLVLYSSSSWDYVAAGPEGHSTSSAHERKQKSGIVFQSERRDFDSDLSSHNDPVLPSFVGLPRQWPEVSDFVTRFAKKV